MRMRVAIDGPAGVGKSTVGRRLAERLGVTFVNTGEMYRAVAWGLLQGQALDELHLALNGQGRLTLNGRPVSDRLYSAEVDRAASQVATDPKVRAKLIALQRRIAQERDVVMEGRDIGTVVLPDAEAKLYLSASLEERARRRAAERGEPYAEVLRCLRERDARDRKGFGRDRPAPDALVLETEGLTIEEVMQRALAWVAERRAKRQERLQRGAGSGKL